MKNLYRFLLTACLAAFGLTLFAERQPYERYQSVVDRQMFGQPPPGFDPTKNPNEISAKDAREKDQELTKEQEQVKSAIHFSMVNVTPAGDTAVGFTDNSDTKNPRHYYLKVGESRDGWTVKEADPLAATMTIAKGDVEVALSLGGNSANGAGTTRSTSAAAVANAATAHRSSALSSRSGGLLGGGTSRSLGSLRERRALRDQARAEEQAAAEEKARIAAEREAQREEERAAEREQREREREEQRAQLMQIQEELKKAREERERNAQESTNSNGGEETESPKGEVHDEV